MSISTLTSGLLALVLPLAGCQLYFSDEDRGPDNNKGPCQSYPGQHEGDVFVRNPDDGTCEYHPEPTDLDCNEECGPCDVSEPGQVPAPSWGLCESDCTGLDEGSCTGTANCQAVYSDFPPEGRYVECWQISGVGTPPPLVQSCEGLNAFTCARLDSCASLRTHDLGALSVFLECRNETIAWPTCENIVEEFECIGRQDCSARYVGEDCSCTGDSCSCNEWIYQSCSG